MMVAAVSRRFGIAIPLALLFGACAESAERADVSAGRPCPDRASERESESMSIVVVRGADAPCAVAFVPVVILRGSASGELPRFPVVAAPGGRWLTATYGVGEFALWSPAGELERLIGPGTNDGGPGEFGRVSDLIVDSIAGTVHVFSNSLRVEIYSLDGEHLDGIRLPAPALMGARLSDGTIASSTVIPMGSPRILLIERDTGPPRRWAGDALVRAVGDGVSSSESPWYQFDHHALPGGEVDFTIRLEVSWFPEPSDGQGRTAAAPLAFTVDEVTRMVFARVEQVPDPNAPPGAAPAAGTREEAREISARYYDGFIEAFTFDGDLVASTRFDSGRDMPWPIGGGASANLWYRINDDATQSIEVLRPELVELNRR
jgi:hypothetical protein